ncbi:MAG: CopG family transcriptional regulator [Deltaproteobacteria bacterium]|nr:CopG family transcriptional regulator [Deltaproteobacteria bacterium]
MKKVAIQVYIDQEQDRVLGYLSKTQKRSKASIIRTCLQDYLARLPVEEDPILKVIGLGDSGYTDISEKHDDYLVRMEK